MTEVDYLLVCLIEECAEVSRECAEIAQRAAKALRFGLDNTVPEDNPLTMRDKLVGEIADLLAVIAGLQALGALPPIPDHLSNEAKQYRRAYALELARKFGRVE